MKAIAFTRPLPINAPDSLVELDLPQPQPGPRDLLVRVQAVSVNPVDTKVRVRGIRARRRIRPENPASSVGMRRGSLSAKATPSARLLSETKSTTPVNWTAPAQTRNFRPSTNASSDASRKRSALPRRPLFP